MEPDHQGDDRAVTIGERPPAGAHIRAATDLVRTRQLESIAAAIAVSLPFVFLVMGALVAYPFVDDVSVPALVPDDWHTYKQFALSVVRDGLSMPALTTSYAGLPHGFLYIYFIALVFAVAGVNSTYVYVAQSVALGLSISLTYLAVRKRLTPFGSLAFLLTLTALMYLDVFRHLTFKLLSENLYFLLGALLLLFLMRSVEQIDRRRRNSFLAGVTLGLVVLTRPSFILSAVMVIAAMWLYSLARGRSVWPPALLSLGCAAGLSAVVARNYAVTRVATFDIVTNTSDWLRPWNLPAVELLTVLAKRSLFVIGFTGPMAPAYRLRPHWMLLWLLWAVYPVVRLSKRRPLEFWEVLLYIYVMCYIGPVVLVADITSYGGRMVISILPLVLVAAFRLLFGNDVPAGSAQPQR
jgi:Dolichyl-phosphate-mannose-protein mannosyltransferase